VGKVTQGLGLIVAFVLLATVDVCDGTTPPNCCKYVFFMKLTLNKHAILNLTSSNCRVEMTPNLERVRGQTASVLI